MQLTIFKRFGFGLMLVLSLILLSGPTALGGGWAVITLDDLPTQVLAEQPLTIGFIVRQHGRTPAGELTPQITATHADSGESFITTAEAQGKLGHYAARLTFPQPGVWNWSINAFGMDQPMPVLSVMAATPIRETETSPPVSWPLLVGVIGLAGAAGSSLLWWRKRTWWAVAPIVATVLVSGAGFAAVANYAEEVEPQAQPSAQVELGRNLFIAKGCIVCHHHSDLSEIRQNFSDFRFGPDLPSLATLTADPTYLQTWLKDPAALKPQTQMPNLELKQTEIEALVAFLTNPEKNSAEASATSALPAGDPVISLAPAKAKLKPADLFFIRSEGAKGPLVAYDMANNVEQFRLPPGIPAADGSHYFAALAQQNSTLLEIFAPKTSRLERRFTLPGRWALSGVSPTGRWLALTRLPAETAPTEIQIIDANSGEVAHSLHLEGNFEVETISAAGDSLFLIEYLPADKPIQYRIRLFDLSAERLQLEALRAKTATEELMTGLAWGGVASVDGRWLLTLYLNTARNVAFIHALNLVDKFPLCIDLPSGQGNFDQLKYYALTFAPNGRTVYAANAALGVVAEVSLDEFTVTRQVEFATAALPNLVADDEAPTNYSVLSQDGQTLYFSSGWDVWGYDTTAHEVSGPYLNYTPIRGLGLSADGQRLFIATDQQPLAIDLEGSKALSLKLN